MFCVGVLFLSVAYSDCLLRVITVCVDRVIVSISGGWVMAFDK